jgi:broad specificity phosphatase PhoE
MINIADIPKHTFYIMRHAKAKSNDPRERHGITPETNFLTKWQGQPQAITARDKLWPQLFPKPTKVISSAMPRAMQTAGILMGRELKPEEMDARFNEMREGEPKKVHRGRLLEGLRDQLNKCAEGEIPFIVSHAWSIADLLEALGGIQVGAMNNTDAFLCQPPQKEGNQWQITGITLDKDLKIKQEKLTRTVCENDQNQSMSEDDIATFLLDRGGDGTCQAR